LGWEVCGGPPNARTPALLDVQLHVVQLFPGSGADGDVDVGHAVARPRPLRSGPLRREHEHGPWRREDKEVERVSGLRLALALARANPTPSREFERPMGHTIHAGFLHDVYQQFTLVTSDNKCV